MPGNQTKESIALAKELHELGVKKKGKCGDWVYVEYPSRYATPPQAVGQPALYERLQNSTVPFKVKFDLWQIHDCLEWLRGNKIFILLQVIKNGVLVSYKGISQMDGMVVEKRINAKTPLEALEKAMIQVKKEQSDEE